MNPTLTLVNTNRLRPPVAPVGLDYVAGAVRDAGFTVEVLDLGLADDPDRLLQAYFGQTEPRLVGLSFRNVDDCFWPSARWFVPELARVVSAVRRLTDAPVVLGGVGYSLFPKRLLEWTGADFGVCGDGERPLVGLLQQLEGRGQWHRVPGLVFREGGTVRQNAPAWLDPVAPPTDRSFLDNARYFREGGQIGVETKRGCPRGCRYCVDPLAKGRRSRLRDPERVADEVETLVRRGVDVLHLCDSEFNIPAEHAHAVCEAFVRRGLGEHVRWYAYSAVRPFSATLAEAMSRAGCVGVNFTTDSAHPLLRTAYGHQHSVEDVKRCIQWCHDNGMAVMLDMLLGGPGETPQTVEHTVRVFRQLEHDCAGAALGVRLYPNTPLTVAVRSEGPLEANPSVRRRYPGAVDLLKPTFYLSAALGERPAALVRQLIGSDRRFFPPQDEPELAVEPPTQPRDHNYSENRTLTEAIAAGARGAYWDILRRVAGHPG